MSSTWSQKLRKMVEQGATIVVASGPRAGEEVIFAPKYDTDREPWILKYEPSDKSLNDREFSGAECKVKDEDD